MQKPYLRATVLAAACLVGQAAHAQLFGDDQARQAILELRQRLDATVNAQNRLVDENTQLRRSMLDLQQQLETLRAEIARGRGQDEQLTRDLAELQKKQASSLQDFDERLKKVESGEAARAASAASGASASEGGGAGTPVSASEKQEYDAALAVFRSGDFAASQTGFANFIKRYPRSTLAPSALFWLGNAQYATRNYKEAITNFRSLLAAAPSHARAAEAMLSIANCQIELKDTRAARATLESLVKTYPQSEAAQAGRDRLAKMK